GVGGLPLAHWWGGGGVPAWGGETEEGVGGAAAPRLERRRDLLFGHRRREALLHHPVGELHRVVLRNQQPPGIEAARHQRDRARGERQRHEERPADALAWLPGSVRGGDRRRCGHLLHQLFQPQYAHVCHQGFHMCRTATE